MRFLAGVGYDIGFGGSFALTPYANFVYSNFEAGSTNLLQLGLGVNWYSAFRRGFTFAATRGRSAMRLARLGRSRGLVPGVPPRLEAQSLGGTSRAYPRVGRCWGGHMMGRSSQRPTRIDRPRFCQTPYPRSHNSRTAPNAFSALLASARSSAVESSRRGRCFFAMSASCGEQSGLGIGPSTAI
jgi:hypothetical protein